MKEVSIKPISKRPEIKTGDRLLDALLAEDVDVMMACGGRGRCATCRVEIDAGSDGLTSLTDRERRTLRRLSQRTDGCRLACQAKVQADGVEARLPDEMFVTEQQDLDDLVGQRAESDIRHPVDGELLIPEGKIITRTYIRKLEGLEDEVDEIKADDALY